MVAVDESTRMKYELNGAMKKKKLEKKKRKDVRERDWERKHEYAFTHDRIKHRRALAKLPQSPAAESPLPTEFTPNAVVVSHAKKWAFVRIGGEDRMCRIDERLKAPNATLLAPGDHVLVESEGDDAVIRGIAPRRTKLCRPANIHKQVAEQVFAANIDALIVVASVAQPRFRPGLVDRFLIAAQIGGVEPILCINKIDLCEALPEEAALYRALGVQVIPTSCVTGEGIPALRELLRDRISVLSGHSGVGKTSLLNALEPSLRAPVSEVSQATQKGRHTTSTARLYELSDGIRIIDTPGIRALGLWGVSPEEIAYYFPEIAEVAEGCRFRDCTHTHEPQCAVRAALDDGRLPRLRYDSYLRVRASLESDMGITPGRIGFRAKTPDAPTPDES